MNAIDNNRISNKKQYNQLLFEEKKKKVFENEEILLNMLGYSLEYKNKKYYTCPTCNSDKMGIYEDKLKGTIKFKCFKCDKNYGVIDIAKNHLGTMKFTETINELYKMLPQSEVELELYKLELKSGIKEKKADEKEIKHLKDGTFLEYFKECKNRLKDNFDYFISRGFEIKDIEFLEKYSIGTDEKGNIIFPTSNYSYIKRNIEINSKGKYINSKSFHEEGHYIWNLKRIKDFEIIYVFEGIFDALSMQVLTEKALAISLSGVGINRIKDEIQSCKGKEIIFLTCFDNDEAGNKATENFYYEIQKLKNVKLVRDVRVPLLVNDEDKECEIRYKDFNARFKRDKREEILRVLECIDNKVEEVIKAEEAKKKRIGEAEISSH